LQKKGDLSSKLYGLEKLEKSPTTPLTITHQFTGLSYITTTTPASYNDLKYQFFKGFLLIYIIINR